MSGRLLWLCIWLLSLGNAAAGGAPDTVRVRITVDTTSGPLRTFVPLQTFGAGLDGHEQGETKRVLTASNIARMKQAGFGPLSYRLRTELGVEAWHWNPVGRWSESRAMEGYWTSDSNPGKPIELSYGYRLPRRGDSLDQANNDSYSRIDDGDEASFWKSNPYLDARFTHESNDRHPQWVVIDLGAPRPVDAIRIQWGSPHARVYRVEYCTNPQADDVRSSIPDHWAAFPRGEVADSPGGSETRRLANRPIRTRFVRLMLLESSPPPGTTSDIRDTLGYAIRELGVGTLDARDRLEDALRHAPNWRRQSTIYVSSTDPWHRAGDRDPGTEQPGLDAIFRSGLTDAAPSLVPVSVLYDTPDNVAAEIAYLLKRGYRIAGVEMGEEPDGQFVTPEDYGALYLQVADALHRVDPSLRLGGPGFQSSVDGYGTWPIGELSGPWVTRFLDYLKSRGRTQDFNFFSFEWYPFDNCCGDTALQLALHPRIFRDVMAGLHADGLPPGLPWLVTEYGYSSFACRPEVDIEGALLNAEAVGLALEQGASQVFLYGLEPASLMDELQCNSWGNNTLFVADDDLHVQARTATFYGARMINRVWVGPAAQRHALFPVRIRGGTRFGLDMISAFALRLPDGGWNLLVLNKDPEDSHPVSVEFLSPTGQQAAPGPVSVTRFSWAEYRWKSAGRLSRPVVDKGPQTRSEPGFPVELSPYSLNVIRLAPVQRR
jgi:hypothetical protein